MVQFVRPDEGQRGDPGEKRKAEKVAQGDAFEAIAREWLALQEAVSLYSNP